MLAPADRLISIIDRLLTDPIPVVEGVKLHKLLTLCRARIEADSAWDTHSDELSRKAFTAAHDTIYRLSAGEIDATAAAAAMAAIIDTCSGLVPPDVFAILNETLKELRM